MFHLFSKCIYMFPYVSLFVYFSCLLIKNNFPLVARIRALLALATRLRHDRPDYDSRGSPENRFLDSQDQNKILKCFRFLYMTSVSYINQYFLAPSPLKPLKSSPRYQNLPGESLTAHSDHRGPLSDPIYLQKWCCFDLVESFLTLFDFIFSELK